MVHQRRVAARWRALFVLLLVAAALAALVFTIRAVWFGARLEASGFVTPIAKTQFNFTSTGPITELSVRPGDHVRAGQVLARQDGGVASAKLSADQVTFTADQAHLVELQAPLRPAQVQQLQLLVNQSRSGLQAAQQKAVGDLGAVHASVAQASAVLQAAQAKLNADQQATQSTLTADQRAAQSTLSADQQAAQSTLATDQAAQLAAASQCATPSSLSVQPSLAVQVTDLCNRLAHQVATDQANLATVTANDQSNLDKVTAGDRANQQRVVAADQQAQAVEAQGVANAGAALSAATAAVNTAQGQQQVGLLAGTPAEIAAAQAAIVRDEAAIYADKRAAQNATLIASTDGLVESVGGNVGDIGSPDGVRSFSPPQPLTQPASGIQLLPAAPQTQAAPPTPFAALVTLDSPAVRIVVQVSESAVRHLRIGQHAKITFPAIPGYHVDGTLDRVEPAAVHESGHVYYLADLALPNGSPNPKLLPGMTADATF